MLTCHLSCLFRALVPMREEVPDDRQVTEDVKIEGECRLDLAVILQTQIR